MRIFVTVGNRTEPFDRLLETVDLALAELTDRVDRLCQLGSCTTRSTTLENVDYLTRSAFRAEIARADAVICHAGVGTIRAAISAGHRPVVLARRAQQGECVNDHQLEIVRALEQRRLVSTVSDGLALRRRLEEMLRRPEERRPLDPATSTDVALVGASLVGPDERQPTGPFGRALLRLLACGAPALERLQVRHPAEGPGYDQDAKSE
ncbi:MAG: hypothetical protein JRI55_36830 [Deltaproteobacteria bacterium]|jgi:UDP-N-acetylglucosamine transferase subunit ALG13|nr:hypothetical protein [Deltaproteobacteria bacterium]